MTQKRVGRLLARRGREGGRRLSSNVTISSPLRVPVHVLCAPDLVTRSQNLTAAAANTPKCWPDAATRSTESPAMPGSYDGESFFRFSWGVGRPLQPSFSY